MLIAILILAWGGLVLWVFAILAAGSKADDAAGYD